MLSEARYLSSIFRQFPSYRSAKNLIVQPVGITGLKLKQLESRVNWFAFQSQDTEDTFMYAAQRFSVYKTLQGFDSETEFAHSERAFCTSASHAQPLQVCGHVVFWTVDDAQVFWPATFYRWLHNAALPSGYEIKWLDHHAFTTTLCQALPPAYGLLKAGGIGDIDEEIGRGEQ